MVSLPRMHLSLLLVAACRAIRLAVVLLQDHPLVINDAECIKIIVAQVSTIVADVQHGILYALVSPIVQARLPNEI